MQRKAMLMLAVVAVLLFSGSRVSAGDAEVAYIRKLYSALGVNHDAQGDVCSYTGVTCESGRHVANQISYKIDLDDRGLNCNQLPDIDDGVELDIYEIDLGGNRGIRGRLPNSWGRLSYLEKLDVSGCSLTGAIPNSWNARMIRVRDIDLSNNAFCYSLPDWNVNNFPVLEEMNFFRNQLQYFSSAFGSFSNSTTLTRVNLGNNKFCACMPNTWTSTVLRNAAISARSDATDASCRNTCRGDECSGSPDSVVATARTSILATLATLLTVVFLMF